MSVASLFRFSACPHLGFLISFAAGIFCNAAFAISPPEALRLQESYHSMAESLQRSPLLRPVQISSQESEDHLIGDLFATVDYGMGTVNAAATNIERWCEVMLLLSNSQACQVKPGKNNDLLQVLVSSSKKADISGATPTDFQLQVHSATADYLDSALTAAEGPMGTQNISLRLQAIPLTATRSFLHLHYAYETTWLGRVAMRAYLQTAGRGKVGFTPMGDANTHTTYIAGARGVIERNTMRYFLGFDCALAFDTQHPPQRFGAMAQCWYGQVEKYPLQLHEMPSTEYLGMKSIQYQKQLKNQPQE